MSENYPAKLTLVSCRECARLRTIYPEKFPCSSYDIPELGLIHLHKAVAERIVRLWNAASD